MATLDVAMGMMVARCKAASGQAASSEDGEATEVVGGAILLLLSGLPSPPDTIAATLQRRTFMAMDAVAEGMGPVEAIGGALVESLLLGYYMGAAE